MARPVEGGWDFVKVGKTYQYKEDWLVGMVKVLEDNSDDEYYSFLVQFVEGTTAMKLYSEPFEVMHIRNLGGIYSGMPQFFEEPCYTMD